MITEDSYGNILPEGPFRAIITHDGHMQHCDLHPHNSIPLLEICDRKDKIKLAGKTDWLPKTFLFRYLPDFDETQTKLCKGGCASKVFPLDTIFDQDGKCPRCASRATRRHD